MNDSDTPLPVALTRRSFLATSAKLSAVVAAAPYISRAEAVGAKGDTVNVALIGCGLQGQALMTAMLRIPGVRFTAVCDISLLARRRMERLLQHYKHEPKAFEDYAEMLATVRELDAVVVATPDFRHAEHTNAALRAGKHVYCEKLMSNTIEGARSMVQTAREAKKLLQIGHQRRSNPYYIHAREKAVRDARLLGRITNASGQWHRAAADDVVAAASARVPQDVLLKYGFADMREYLNWRWYKKFGGGPISDLGAHQIDVFNWMLGTNPRSLIASGGRDYYKGRDWYDNATALYEYVTKEGVVRATYDVLTTTSAGGGYFEYFMGDQGTLKLSEDPANTKLFRENHAPMWDVHAARNIIAAHMPGVKPWDKPRPKLMKEKTYSAAGVEVYRDARESAALSVWELPVVLDKPIHQPHLENFFAAIRQGTPLNCPAEEAFASAVTVLRVNEAIEAERKLAFAPAEFVA